MTQHWERDVNWEKYRSCCTIYHSKYGLSTDHNLHKQFHTGWSINYLESDNTYVILSVRKFSKLSLPNVMNRFMIENHWDLLDNRRTPQWCDHAKKKSSFWVQLIFILVGTLITKIAEIGPIMSGLWSVGIIFLKMQAAQLIRSKETPISSR